MSHQKRIWGKNIQVILGKHQKCLVSGQSFCKKELFLIYQDIFHFAYKCLTQI
jgi:hypothetical protein